jgi:phosphatidylethanolamine-binding protein (PEBP) family uncharacterized protein
MVQNKNKNRGAKYKIHRGISENFNIPGVHLRSVTNSTAPINYRYVPGTPSVKHRKHTFFFLLFAIDTRLLCTNKKNAVFFFPFSFIRFFIGRFRLLFVYNIKVAAIAKKQ